MISSLIRPNILKLKPYSSARDEFKGEASVYLDANENNYGSVTPNGVWNRYPDPLQWEVKEKLSAIKNVAKEQIFLGNGSDEAIDLLYRIFCEPGKDKALVFPPTYGMYQVSADINDVEILQQPLTADFQLPMSEIKSSEILNTEGLKLVYVCSPNNPSGNSINGEDIHYLLQNFNGIVVVDEAYIDFSDVPSWTTQLDKYPNLVVMQTFSKAWGMAALRLGMAFASQEIISLFNKVKPPYNINLSSQQQALEALNNKAQLDEFVKETISNRNDLVKQLQGLSLVKRIYPTDANFVLLEVDDAKARYNQLVEKGIIVRNRHSVVNNCLRITVGKREENELVVTALR